MDAFRLMFRENDIRGRVNDDELNSSSIAVIASAFAKFLLLRDIHEIVVGYDNREYSQTFSESAINALISFGLTVYDIGLTLSPAAYFAQHYFKARGVMMITASHNPNGWSGLKLGCNYSQTLVSQEIGEVFFLTGDSSAVKAQKGKRIVYNIYTKYLDNIISRLSVNREYLPKIVVDAGNGGAGLFAYSLFQRLGCTVFQLNCDPDTSYPHYFPNPSEIAALKRMREMVTHPYIMADMGLAFDGDGDRLGVMDSSGNSIWSDRILMMLASSILEKHQGAKIVFDIKCTQALIDTIQKMGGIAVMCNSGHSQIKLKMNEIGAALAGERSGHIFYGSNIYWGFDDALFSGAKLIEFISWQKRPIKQILEDYPSYYTSTEIKAFCDDSVKYDVVKAITNEFKKEFGDAVIDISGARVQFNDGWGLVRASSNLPELAMVFEGKTQNIAKQIYLTFKDKLDKHNEISSNWENLPNW